MALSSRSYLIRALYDWIIDNNWIPHLLINATVTDVHVPDRYINSDGNVILNISPEAVRGLLISSERIIFTTRFEGVATQVCVPPKAVRAIYAKDNGEGMVFAEEENALENQATHEHEKENNSGIRPNLGTIEPPKGLYLTEKKSSPAKKSPSKYRKPTLTVVK